MVDVCRTSLTNVRSARRALPRPVISVVIRTFTMALGPSVVRSAHVDSRSKPNLKNHLLIHSGQKPFECAICLKKFSLSCNLRSHMRTHHHDMPLDFSSSSFSSSSDHPSVSMADEDVEDEDMIDVENED